MVWAWQQLQNGEFANLALGLSYDTAKTSGDNVYVFTYYSTLDVPKTLLSS